MLLSSRRTALLHLLLAGMQAAWITAFLLVVWPRDLPVGLAYGIVVAWLLLWMLALELLSRAVESPLYDTIALVSLVAVSVLLVWLALPASAAWIDGQFGDPSGWRGLPGFLVLAALNVVLWQRASAATSRDLNFFSVGVTFRGGLLLLVAGGALLSGIRGIAVFGLLWVFLALGLTAVAISRVTEKASEAQSMGRLLPARRLAQVILAALVAATGAWLFSLIYTREGIAAFFRLFSPLWELLKPLAVALGVLLGQLLNPLLEGLEAVLARLMRQAIVETQQQPPVAGGPGSNPLENIPRWPLDLARTVLVGLLIIGVVLGVIIFLLLFLERVRKSGMSTEDEDEGLERATMGGGILHRAADALRGAGALVRRFGLGRELLAAISVENIYANVCRIARQRGHPRPVSQPPDMYLPALALAFPGQDKRLQRITNAYMRVHYGEHPVPSAELTALRQDYRALREGVLAEATTGDGAPGNSTAPDPAPAPGGDHD